MEQTINKLFDFVKDTIEASTLEKVKFCYNEGGDYIYEDFEEATGLKEKHGCTKIVLFVPNIDEYVVKIPFQGTRYCVWNEDTEEYELDESSGSSFSYANSRVDCQEWDYCEAEAIIYEMAVAAGVGEFFAKTFYLGDIYGYPIYAAEKIKYEWWDLPYGKKRVSEDSINKARNLSHCVDIDLNGEALSLFVEQYGYEKTSMFVDFLNELQLEDFHNGNIGFDKDGKLKIIDYSCYDE